MVRHNKADVKVGGDALLDLRPTEQFSGSLSNRVYLSLREAILRLELQPGQAIRKPQICALLGVSRAPVSEAIARLVFDRLVEVIPQNGTFVSRFSMADIREGAFLREALETAAVERLAETITEDQLRQLQRNLRLQEVLAEDEDFSGLYTADAEMHQLILSFTGYRRLVEMAENIWMLVERARRLLLPSPGRARETLNEHRAIVTALAKHDAAAARKAARFHIRKLTRMLEQAQRQRPDLFGATEERA